MRSRSLSPTPQQDEIWELDVGVVSLHVGGIGIQRPEGGLWQMLFSEDGPACMPSSQSSYSVTGYSSTEVRSTFPPCQSGRAGNRIK